MDSLNARELNPTRDVSDVRARFLRETDGAVITEFAAKRPNFRMRRRGSRSGT